MNALRKHIYTLPKHLLRLSLISLVGIAILWFALQAFALRDPERYRPQLIDLFQRSTALNLTIGSIEHAPWRVQPGVLLKNIVIYNDQKQPILTVPSLEARLSLFNLFRGRLDFSRLKISVDELTVLRDKEGKWYLASLLIPTSNSGTNPFLHWLMQQGHCNLSIKRLVLHDQFTEQPEYVFRQLTLELKNTGSRHIVKATVIPDHYFGEALNIDGDLYGSQSDNLLSWSGDINWSTHRFNFTSLTPWFGPLSVLRSGYGAINAHLLINEKLQFGIEADVDAHNLKGHLKQALNDFSVDQVVGHIGYYQLEKGFKVNTRQLSIKGNSTVKLSRPLNLDLVMSEQGNKFSVNQLHLDDVHNDLDQVTLTDNQRQLWYKLGLQGELDNINASWLGELAEPQSYLLSLDFHQFGVNPYQTLPAIHDFTGHAELRHDGGELKGQGSSLTLNYPQTFTHPIYLNNYAVDVNWLGNQNQAVVNVNDINVSNVDMAGDFSGTMNLTTNGPTQSQLHGHLQRADLNAIWRYMPLTVNQDAREWLKNGLVKGLVKEVSFNIDGDLQQFPFASEQVGKFTVNAKVVDAQVNFNHKWPVIDNVAGDFYMKEAELGFKATSGSIVNNLFKEVSVTIPDLIHSNQILLVEGKTQSSIKDTLDFIKKSPVSDYINHVTDPLTGAGVGELDLKMHIPLTHTLDTTLKGDFKFIDATLDDGNNGIPPISALNGHLKFTETEVSSDILKASVLGGESSLLFSTDDQHNTVLKAEGMADATQLYNVYGNSLLKNVSGSSKWSALFKFNKKKTEVLLDSSVLLVNEPVTVHLSTRQDGLIDLALAGNTSVKGLTVLFPNPLFTTLDSSVNWNGHVLLSKKYDDVSFSLAALVLKKPVFMTLKGSLSHSLVADVAGRSDIPSLSRLGLDNLNSLCQGAFDWHARFEKNTSSTTITFTSNLKGVTIAGPDPYQKSANQSLPLTLVIEPLESGKTLLSVNLDNWFGLKTYYESKKEGGFYATRGVVNLGGPYLGEVGPGFALTGRLQNSNLDELMLFWDKHADLWQSMNNESVRGKKPAKNSLFGKVENIDVNVANVIWRNRQWQSHRLRANWRAPQWAITIRGEQINGSVNWNKDNQGFIKANFSQLVIPDTLTQQKQDQLNIENTKANKPKAHKKSIPSDLAKLEDLRKTPDIDLIAEHCQLGKKSFSRLEFAAQRQEDVWHISRLFAVAEGGEIQGNGKWYGTGDDLTQTEFKLVINGKNLGDLFKALGYNKMISRGEGTVTANLSWLGGPKDYDFDNTSGSVNLELHDGQFSKVDPGGAGRIIGLLSLQSLPRRITLDFHDIFSQGFAFDTVKGNFKVKEGVMNTPDFVMSGPAARVKLKGLIDVPQETTDLVVKVDPAVGGDLSLAGTLIGGPVVGAATYLVQKILSNPLDKVLSYEYRINGDWDNPQIDSVDGGNAESTNKALN